MLEGKTVLIAEDEFLIFNLLEDTVASMDCKSRTRFIPKCIISARDGARRGIY